MINAYAITGPTASGKTALGIAVAKELGCEIVSCDSMQIYRYMDIGTAKPTPEERAEVPHCLIDFLDPGTPYSAMDYVSDALAAAKGISERGKTPLFVGGTGLYIDSLIRAESEDVPKSDPAFKEKYQALTLTKEGREELYRMLLAVDPQSALSTHRNNVRRVLRALEIYETTGIPKSVFDEATKKPRDGIRVKMVTLDFSNRDLLYSRIDRRVDEMMDCGLLAEVERLYDLGYLSQKSTAAQAIGYKELLGAIRGETTVGEAVEQLKQSSRRYAKRQLTWFRKEPDAVRLTVDTPDGMMRPFSDLVSECINIFANNSLQGE
ncbi:MAG: tRNA (adenosine(37)-N6)-dimethylallyltransferase MiaA [Clostridia bacterium]|nr:tRNA (adenosine(37)-N6)-dimethylallyltransferase MiaA [Clostridia bacterium]